MPQVGYLPRQSANISGVVAPGAVLRFYQTGTSTPQNAYTDADLQNAVTSLTADAAGLLAKWYLNPNAAADYRYTLETSAGAVYYTEDGISRLGGLDQALVGAALYPRTDAETAAGVTPLDYGYAPGDDRRYASFDHFCKVVSQGVEGHIYGDHAIAAAVDITGDATIIVHGHRTITATAVMDYMLRHSGRLTIEASGELLFDGDTKVTYACLHSTSKIPNLKNVRFLDSNFGINGGATVSAHDYGLTGDGVWDNVVAENCADVGFSVRGHAGVSITGATSANPIVLTCASTATLTSGAKAKFMSLPGDFGTNLNETTQTITVINATTFSIAVNGSGYAAYTSGGTAATRSATLLLRNCKTKGTTGSDNFDGSGSGYLYHIAGLKSYVRYGGLFEGDADALSTDGYKCDHVEIVGGWHKGVGRGPTLGFETQLFQMIGTTTSESAGNAASADITDGSGETVGVGILNGNLASRCARTARTTGSIISLVNNLGYECTSATGHVAINGAGTRVWIDGNFVYATLNSNSYAAFAASEDSTPTLGVNYTNSVNRQSYVSGDTDDVFTRTVANGNVRSVTANTDLLPTDRILIVDATAGAVDIDLFDETETKLTGFEFTIIKTDATNSMTLTFQGGAANGETINGASSLSIPANYNKRPIRVVCTDGATGTWRATPNPVLAYSVSNPTSDRSYDADAAAVTETNDVLATLLSDLGLR